MGDPTGDKSNSGFSPAGDDPVERLLMTSPAAFVCDSEPASGATVRVLFESLADAQKFHQALVDLFNHTET